MGRVLALKINPQQNFLKSVIYIKDFLSSNSLFTFGIISFLAAPVSLSKSCSYTKCTVWHMDNCRSWGFLSADSK